MKRKLFFLLLVMVSVTVCVMVAVLSCEHRMDIRNFVEDELARDRSELVVTYYTDAAKTNKYEAPALVTGPSDNPNTTVYLPSGKTIYAEVPVENKRDLDLQAYIKLDNPSDAPFFDTLDGSTPYFEDVDGEKRHTIAAEDIVTNDGKATVTFPLNFKATLENDTTAEGKSVLVTLVIERIVEGGGTPFSEKKLTIACNSPPPALKDVQLVKNKDTGKVSLLCNIDASEDELKLRHRDLDIFQIYRVDQMASPSGEVVVDYNPTASENLTVSTSSISYATIADIANYENFGESSQPSNIVVNKTFEWKSDAISGDLHYAVSMIDKTGIKGNISEVNARLLKLTTPTVTDIGDSTAVATSGNQAHILYLGGETFGSVKASHAKTASSDGGDIYPEHVSTQVTIQYTLKEYKQSGGSVPTPPATSGTPNSDVTIDIGNDGEKMYELILWAEAPGYASSNSMRYIFTVQSKIYVDKSGNQINAGFEDTPLPSLQDALNKIGNLKTKNPKIVLKSDITVDGALIGFKQGDDQERLTITSVDKNNPNKITMKTNGTTEISFTPSSGATVELVSVKIVGGVKAISNTKLTIAGNSEITNGSGQSGTGLTVETNATAVVDGDTKISGRTLGISNSGTLSIGDNACICPPQENGSYSTGMRGLSCKNGTVTIMEQAKIEHCQQSGGGGTNGSGIYISGGTVTMQGGTISNCKSLKGGAVYVNTGGTFIMNGGTIENNIATAEGTSVGDKGNGGGIYNKGTVYLSGNAIIGDNTAIANATEYDHSNYAEGAGGGIYNEGTLYLGANNGGNGSVVANGSPYIMHNYSKENGGGIYNANGKSITHYSCSIKCNGNSGGQYGYRNNVFMHWTGQYELKKVGYGDIGSIYLFGGHDNGVTTNPYNTPTVSFGTLISALSPKIPLYVPFDCPNNTQLVTKDVNNGTQQIPNSFTVTVFTQGSTGGIQQEQKTLDTDGRLSN